MSIVHGRVKIKTKPKSTCTPSTSAGISSVSCRCSICHSLIDNDARLICLNPKCNVPFHILCLARVFKDPGQYIPVQGNCPACRKYILWGDLIRKKNGCSDYEEIGDDDQSVDSSQDGCWDGFESSGDGDSGDDDVLVLSSDCEQ